MFRGDGFEFPAANGKLLDASHRLIRRYREQAAQRELAEESNISVEDFQQIGWFYADNRRTNAKLYVVCARGTFRDNYSLQPDDTEFISSNWLEISKLEQMISNGQIVNYSMLAAWALFKLR